MPFDIFKTEVVAGTAEEYLDFIRSYFNVCYNKRILEIGPFTGHHTKEIIKNSPAHIEVIEGYSPAVSTLQTIQGINKITQGDALQELVDIGNFDIVICFGVLYHLHSPLHLLELIVNNCRPTYIMLDCVFEKDAISVLPESINVAGSCQTQPNWKSCGVNIVLPFLTYKECLEKMGYELTRANLLNITSISKNNSWIATWKLKENYDQPI